MKSPTNIIMSGPIPHTKISYSVHEFMADEKSIIKAIKWECYLFVDDGYYVVDKFNIELDMWRIAYNISTSKRIGKKKLIKYFKENYKGVYKKYE